MAWSSFTKSKHKIIISGNVIALVVSERGDGMQFKVYVYSKELGAFHVNNPENCILGHRDDVKLLDNTFTIFEAVEFLRTLE